MSTHAKVIGALLVLATAMGSTGGSGCDSDLIWLQGLAPLLEEGPPVITSIAPDRTENIYVGESVTFTAHVSGGVPPLTYLWGLDYETTQWDGTNPFTAVMTTPGLHTVTLYVSDSSDSGELSDPATTSVWVLAAPTPSLPKPQVSLGAYTTTIPPDQTLTITATASGGTPPYTYFWLETGGAVWMQGGNTYTFWPGSPGQSTVYCTVQDANGAEPEEPAYIDIYVMEQ